MVERTELTNWAVDLIGVRKTYRGKVEALRGVNVQVGRGEIFGLLGPNGAGKTTLVKIMMSIVRPDHVIGTVLGRPLGHKQKLARIGYLPEGHRFPPYLTGRQLLDYYGALGKVPASDRRERGEKLLERLDLTGAADRKIGQYSKGMLQRLGLAQAMLNDPDLLVLDEPTDGLDPVGRMAVREMLTEYRKEGRTVFLNSHLLSELEMLCDRVSIMINGWVARQGSLKELTEESLEYRISVEAEPGVVRNAIPDENVTFEDGVIVVPGHDRPRVNRVVDKLRAAGIEIAAVVPKRFSLEEVFMQTLNAAGGAPVAAGVTSRPPADLSVADAVSPTTSSTGPKARPVEGD